MSADLRNAPEVKIPDRQAPRIWFLTSANSPVGTSLCRILLEHGDCVVAGVSPAAAAEEQAYTRDFKDLLAELSSAEAKDSHLEANDPDRDYNEDPNNWKTRLLVVALDVRNKSQCQAAVAEAVSRFGKIDVLFCSNSEVVVGTVEELSQTPRTLSLVNDQFETNFFGIVNIIKAALPELRDKKKGHIILLTAITGHLGTPGLSIYCASQWAIEGYCDSLAYEIAPFNIKMTIVQPNMEVNVLTHCITSTPPMACYTEENNPAPLSRNILSSLLDKIEGSSEPTTGDQLHSNTVQSLYPPLSKKMREALVAETVHAVAAIGGHENPPARHIVGSEAIASVKAKLKTVSEELEDFVECSSAVDVGRADDS